MIVYQGAEVETSAATVAGFLAERGVDAAKALPGVRAVLTYKDLNEINLNPMLGWPPQKPLLDQHFRYVGDSVALLVPGIGAQGGDLEGVLRNGLTADKTGLVINSSRGIIFASNGEDFAEAAEREAAKLHNQMAAVL